MTGVLAVAAGVYNIPRLCLCDWAPPDYRRRPHRRRWTLTRINPSCPVHGKSGAEQ